MTPVIYLYLEVFQEKVLDKTSFFRSHRVKHGAAAAAGHPAPVPVPHAELFVASGRPSDEVAEAARVQRRQDGR